MFLAPSRVLESVEQAGTHYLEPKPFENKVSDKENKNTTALSAVKIIIFTVFVNDHV